MGIKVFIVGCVRYAKSHFSTNKAFWRLDLTTGTSRANCLARLEVLSCSALAVVTHQLPLHALQVCHSDDLPIASQLRDPVTILLWIAHFLRFLHTLSHTTLTWFSPKFHTLSHTTLTWFPPKYRVSKCYKQICHAIKPTHDWINSTLQSLPLASPWQNPKTNSRLNMWVGNSCQNSFTS